MNARYLATLVLAAMLTGCSFYDVATISADMALDLFTDVNEGKQPHDEDRFSFWDPDTSECIKIEKDSRSIESQLDAIEDGKDFVILPTGEKYPVHQPSRSDELLLGPTSTCLLRNSD